MTDSKRCNADASQDAMTDNELDPVRGGAGVLFDAVLPQVLPLLAQVNPPTPAGPRPGVVTTHRSN